MSAGLKIVHGQERNVLTHAELVLRAERWLRGTRRCIAVVIEMDTLGREMPDAIGWTSGDQSQSILVECKTSRADFFRDRKKPFRRHPERGMGDLRFYMVSPGIIKPDELPSGWGLLEARDKQVRVIVQPTLFNRQQSALNERPLLCWVLRKLQEGK